MLAMVAIIWAGAATYYGDQYRVAINAMVGAIQL